MQDDATTRRADAEVQAYQWARVAGDVKGAVKARETARQLSNSSNIALTRWQEWLLEHIPGDGRLEVSQAIALAEMWVRVAAVQGGGHGGGELL